MSGMATPKRYVQRTRAATAAQTRARILAAARELIPTAESSLGVDAIARHAGVAVQSVYDHFGSKGGLLIAVVNEVQASAGLYDAFVHVFRSPDGEAALRRMLAATFGLWDGAWPFVEFTLRARRTDAVVGREMDALDTLRHAHLWAICRRLQFEGRIRERHSPTWAADQVFALSTPYMYEDLVVRRGWRLKAATDAITRAVLAGVIEPGTSPLKIPSPDWRALEEAAAERAKQRGADAVRVLLDPRDGPGQPDAPSGPGRTLRFERKRLPGS
jgi:AcrR family transcriptional regulator